MILLVSRKCSYKMLHENRPLSNLFWAHHLWSRGYFVATLGNHTDEMIMETIENQSENVKEDDLSISQS